MFLVFYSEGGPDCLMDKKEAIQHCLNTSFSKYMPPGGEPSLSSLPAFKFEEDQCKYVEEYNILWIMYKFTNSVASRSPISKYSNCHCKNNGFGGPKLFI